MEHARGRGTHDGAGGLALGPIARMVGYLALKKLGGVTGAHLDAAVDARRALLAECTVDSESGAVTWRGGRVSLSDAARRLLQRALDRLLDDATGAGVDVDLAEGALELREALRGRAETAAAPHPELATIEG
jgi:hypothetical protein